MVLHLATQTSHCCELHSASIRFALTNRVACDQLGSSGFYVPLIATGHQSPSGDGPGAPDSCMHWLGGN
jgi:hypothetical protein